MSPIPNSMQMPQNANMGAGDSALLDEIRALKQELQSIYQQQGSQQPAAPPEPQKRMTLEEFLEQQKPKESRADSYGETFRIIGSNKRMKADVLENNFFVAGNKVYKWGDTLHLDG